MLKKYILNILISFDQLLNTILGGDPDMTISSRLGRNYKGTWMANFVDFLFSWQKREGSTSHVENAAYWEDDKGEDAIISQIKKDNHLL